MKKKCSHVSIQEHQVLSCENCQWWKSIINMKGTERDRSPVSIQGLESTTQGNGSWDVMTPNLNLTKTCFLKMKHNESFWQNSIVFCGQEHLLYRFVGYWCAWVMQILSIRDVWFGRPSWSHRRQQLLRQLLTFSFSAITWLVIFSYWDPANNAIFEKIGLRRSRYVWFTTLFWSKDVQSIKIAPRFWTKGRRPVEMLQLQRMWPHQPKMPELRMWMSPRRQRDWENGDRGITYITVYPTIYHWGWFIIGFGTFIGIRNFRHWWYIVHAAGPRCFVTLTVIICSWKGSELRCRMSKEYRHFVQLEALDIFGLWSHVESVWRSRWSPSQTQRRGLFGQVLSFTGIHRYFHLCILQAVETEVEQIGDKLDTLTKKISNVRGLYFSRFSWPSLSCMSCMSC